MSALYDYSTIQQRIIMFGAATSRIRHFDINSYHYCYFSDNVK